ncbi:hypothetical protein TNCV_2478361 [Trichonephila clavipes]|nr:hypothetical protein TNCV_2478361 [Trichonephila clavipes]
MQSFVESTATKVGHEIVPSENHWYQCSRPRGSQAHCFNRQEQTILALFRSGHLKSMKFSEGMPVVQNVDKITENFEVDWHVSSRSITQKLKLGHKMLFHVLIMEVEIGGVTIYRLFGEFRRAHS